MGMRGGMAMIARGVFKAMAQIRREPSLSRDGTI